MKIILKQEVEQLGNAGDVVEVAAGYARNYLLPRGFAAAATSRSVKELEHQKRLVADRIARETKTAMELKKRLEGVACKIAREAGEEDKLFGSVTNRDIADALAEEGIEVDHKRIQLENPIKNLGVFHVNIKLAPELTAAVKVWVVSK